MTPTLSINDLPLLELIGRMVLASVLGALIGWERESHGRAAGLRTMILVCMGSCLIMITSLHVYRLFQHLDGNTVVRLDPARIAYGVITGIGFIGAGAIMRQDDRIRGLTTAACLWVVTAVGLTIGCGFYGLALAATVIAWLTLAILIKLERHAMPETYNYITVVIEDPATEVAQLKSIVEPIGLEVLRYRMEREMTGKTTTFELMVRYRSGDPAEKVVNALSQLPRIRSAAWR